MKQTMVGNSVVAVRPITLPEDEAKQQVIVLTFLLKVLLFFPRGIVLSKFNKFFCTVFPTIAMESDGGWVPMVVSARDYLLENGWVEKIVKSTKAGKPYNIIVISGTKKEHILPLLSDDEYDDCLETAMNILVEEQGISSSGSTSGFDAVMKKQPPNVTENDMLPF